MVKKNHEYKNKPLIIGSWLSDAKNLQIPLHQDDIRFVMDLLPSIPYDIRRHILNRYLDIWIQYAAECEDRIAAENWGRKAANNYLRNYLNVD